MAKFTAEDKLQAVNRVSTLRPQIKITADTYLDITEKLEEDELKKFASYTKRADHPI